MQDNTTDSSTASNTELSYDEEYVPQSNVDSSASQSPENKLVQIYVMFLFMWQSLFRISDAGLEILLKFFYSIFHICSGLFADNPVLAFAKQLPQTRHMARKVLHAKEDDFVRYVSCNKCCTIYLVEDCRITLPDKSIVSKKCAHVEFPLHPHLARRAPCGATLMKKVKTSSGTVVLSPRNLYCYKSIIGSLQEMLQRPNFASQCELWRKRVSVHDKYSDIYDGQVWKDFLDYNETPFLSVPYNFAFTLNVDWFQPFHHSTYSIGVIYLAILNLPRYERYKPENVVVVGIIPGPHEPKLHINSFLEPLVDELMELWQGVIMKSSQGMPVLVKAALLCVACDIPASRKVSGFVGPQAIQGCSKCTLSFPTLVFGEKPDYSNFDRSKWKPRDSDLHSQISKKYTSCKTLQARKMLERSHGLRYSVLTRLPYFSPPRMTIIDPMHNLFLGTAKYILNVWKELKFLTTDDFVEIQALVDRFVAPSDIGRIPLKISSGFADFTADQWRNWILYYSLPSLKNRLLFRHYNLWLIFVKACHLLCRRTITANQLEEADSLILQFCQTYVDLYGKQYCTPNLHLHGHLASCVQDYGPVYSFWLYSFERMNGILGSYHTNNKDVSLQLMRHFLNSHSVGFDRWPVEFRSDLIPLISKSSYCKGSLMQSTLEGFLHRADKEVQAIPPVYENVFSSIEKDALKEIFTPTTEDGSFEILALYKRCRAINVGPFQLGSCKSKFVSSSRVMVKRSGAQQPWLAEIQYYAQCAILEPGGETRVEWVVAVSFFFEHNCRVWYGYPAEVWSTATLPDIVFIPISNVISRIVYVESVVNFGRIAGEQKVLVVVPISSN